jgi:hypothetical protein
MTNAERQRKHRQRLTDAGLVQVNLIVPPHAVADLQRVAELLRANPDLTVARLASLTTGKLSGIKRGPGMSPADFANAAD